MHGGATAYACTYTYATMLSFFPCYSPSNSSSAYIYIALPCWVVQVCTFRVFVLARVVIITRTVKVCARQVQGKRKGGHVPRKVV